PSAPLTLGTEDFVIEPHHLYTNEGGASRGPSDTCPGWVLNEVSIPKSVVVHLGTPSSNARNVTVPFVDYIKNVACCEIYPTWPVESLKANIYAQISLVMNRIFTEWYLSKGKTFTITGSPSYDQKYEHGRNIFENISKLVDEIFNTYIRKQGTVNPYFAEYCDGKTVSCKGMKQWGTVTYANQGLSALSILRKYYTNIELVTTNNIKNIPNSYGGTPLKIGSTGTDVRILQRQLNRIAKDYPFMGTEEVNGVFSATTASRVKKFQKQFSLTQDGVVGKSTWYKISYIYVSVTRLAQLTSEGEKPNGEIIPPAEGSWPNVVYRIGSRGANVERIQFYLNAIGKYNPSIPPIATDGIFGVGTETAVKAFQTLKKIPVDGAVG
ncbi:MAG: peptidoglycan-binding protein, partial [Oscillospiraceae bacterium]